MPERSDIMITRITKARSSTLGQVADFVLSNGTYLKETFPECDDREKLLAELRNSYESWSFLSIDKPAALFRLHLSGTNALLEKFLPSPAFPFEPLIRSLKGDLERMKVESLVLQVPEEMTEGLTKNGFQKLRVILRLSGPVVETKLMPILPLNNPTKKDIPVLAKLLHEAYGKSPEGKLLDLVSAENLLRDIMTGTHGPYVAEASFMSGMTQSVVSACLVTLSSPREADVTQLFTHPLYRARGLATKEVATSMNKLAKRDVRTLTVWIDETNEVARRLFNKLGLKQDRELAEMGTSIP